MTNIIMHTVCMLVLLGISVRRPAYWYAATDVYNVKSGAGSAMLGKEGAMACTVAVETVIGEHYDR